MEFTVTGKGLLPKVELTGNGTYNGVTLYRLVVSYDKEVVPDPFSIHFGGRANDSYSVWNPDHLTFRGSWFCWNSVRAEASRWAPIHVFMDKNDMNLEAVALGDPVHATKLTCGVHDRKGTMNARIDFFCDPSPATSGFETILLIDRQYRPYYESIAAIRSYWEEKYPSFQTPEAAYRRLYSTWYSFFNDIRAEDVLAQCRMAKPYGLDTVILDAGWALDEGYWAGESSHDLHEAGNWEPNPVRFADMRGMVDELHRMGTKMLLWIATPFIGKDSIYFDGFKDKLLRQDANNTEYYVLDPRYAEVRSWYVEKLSSLMRRFALDGFKLDFIEKFSSDPQNTAMPVASVNERMDVKDIGEATNLLLRQIAEALTAMKPDVMIEFRQEYVGPVMQSNGNMFRVCDCGYGAMFNRINGIDIRLICPKVAVHSDMLMWNYDASPEAAADQLSNVLFLVPQISMRFEKLSEEHRRMLKFYLDFIDDNRDVLQKGKLIPLHPDALYPAVYAQKDSKVIAALYDASSFALPEGTEKFALVNAAGRGEIMLDLRKSALKGRYVVKDCMGNETERGILQDKIVSVNVPWNGILFAE